MQIVIGSTTSQPFPLKFAAPTIETKQTWAQLWTLAPDITLESCAVHAGAVNSECRIKRRYGHVKMPYEQDFPASDRTAKNLKDWWIRLRFAGDNGMMTQFVGQIEDQSTDLYASTSPSGVQDWLALGGLKQLSKIVVSEAIFLNADSTTSRVEWVPAMNERDKRGMVVGNKCSGVQLFYGGTDTWNHLQYLQYILGNFVNQPTGPQWSVSDSFNILQAMQTTIRFPENANVAQMLQELIPVKYGVDFCIVPTDTGFQINVFALSKKGAAIAGQTMPGNNNIVKLELAGQRDLLEVQIIESTQQKYDKIEVCGRRIVVCGSASGAEDTHSNVLLQPKWSSTLEDSYISANNTVGTSSYFSGAGDEIRKTDLYREVYTHYGVPFDWDHDSGAWSVACDDNGNLIQQADFQNYIRCTLNWIPLKEGFDYSQNPAADNTANSVLPDFKHPNAWIKDFVNDAATPTNPGPVWVQCNLSDMHVSVPYNDWGVIIDATPPHNLALNHWTAAQFDTTSLDCQRYDYDYLVATFAIESDHRIRLAYTQPAASRANDGSIMTIIDEGCEMWVLLPNTIIGVITSPASEGDPDANPAETVLQNSGPNLRILRNDVPRLAMLMAGAIARYSGGRARAMIRTAGFKAWAMDIGAILDVVQQGGVVTPVNNPVTSIEWKLMPTPETIIRAGYG